MGLLCGCTRAVLTCACPRSPCLRLDPVHGLNELSSPVRRRVCEDDQPQPVTLPPEDILPIGSVGLRRIEQRAVKRLLRNPRLEHFRLGMTAHGAAWKARTARYCGHHAVVGE